MAEVKQGPSAKEIRRQARERFSIAARMEAEYLRSLRMLTRQITHIVKGMAPNGVVKNPAELQNTLRAYAEAVKPWARSAAEKILLRLARKDEAAWIKLGRTMGKELRKELNEAPTGEILRRFLDEQVHLITSLPIEAAEKVHELTLEAALDSTRHLDVAKRIMNLGKVTENRAKLIARTEIARVASGLTLARSQHVGATSYYWRTSGDADVRESHKNMNGKLISIAQAPEVEPGKFYHAGQFANCRCWVDPVLDDRAE